MNVMKEIDKYLKNTKDEKKNRFVNQTVSIIGSLLNAGQELAGVELACDELRKSGLHDVIKSVEWETDDLGNIVAEHIKEKTEELKQKEEKEEYYNNIKHVEVIGKFSEQLYLKVDSAMKKKNFVLNVGGDHSVAFSSIIGSLQNYQNLRVVWIDAHGDINIPETSPSKNYHGMPLAHVLGFFTKRVPFFEWAEKLKFLKPENVVILGLRDIDEYEKIILKTCNINYYTMFDIEKNGIYKTICDGLKVIDNNDNFPIHVSLDIDSIDSEYAPATGTIAKGGLTYREIHLLLKVLADTKRVVAMDLVEYNPNLDVEEKSVHGDSLGISTNAKKTAKLCLELVARILGDNYV